MLYCFLYKKTGERILLQRAVKRMQFFKKIRIGQRAVKTALSVGIALAVAQILGSSLPIFAAIGAISVMSRTWSDSLKESLTQVAGTFLGYLIRMRFCTLAAVAAAVLSVDGSRHALRHHTLYRAAAEFCHSAREHCVRGCLSVHGRRRRGPTAFIDSQIRWSVLRLRSWSTL